MFSIEENFLNKFLGVFLTAAVASLCITIPFIGVSEEDGFLQWLSVYTTTGIIVFIMSLIVFVPLTYMVDSLIRPLKPSRYYFFIRIPIYSAVGLAAALLILFIFIRELILEMNFYYIFGMFFGALFAVFEFLISRYKSEQSIPLN